MREPIFEFIVKGTVMGESGRLTVIGRCGDVPIRTGDIFDALFRYQPRAYPDEFDRPPVRTDEQSVRLRVECINAYECCLDELGEGMTGSLALIGEGVEHVAPGWILGSHAMAPCCASSD